MKTNKIITISREFGTGGRTIGKLLAEKLGIPFYDKSIIDKAAEASGLSADFIAQAEQKLTSSMLFNFVTFGYQHPDYKPLSDQVYIAEYKVIKEIAAQGPCVIVGRCADSILREKHDLINIFIYADMAHKIERCVTHYNISLKDAEKEIKDREKQRSRHYQYYSEQVWGNKSNYDLCVNAGALGIEGSVELLNSFVELLDK